MPPSLSPFALASVMMLASVATLGAQSAAHLGVRGVVHGGASQLAEHVGASLQLDVTARERVDVRFAFGQSRGTRPGFVSCGDAAVNCAPRQVDITTRMTSVGVSLPVRLTRRGGVDWRLVPGLDGHGVDGSLLLGASLGVEARYRRTTMSRLEVMAAADMGRTGAFPAAIADGTSYDGLLRRYSLGVRYRFYSRR